MCLYSLSGRQLRQELVTISNIEIVVYTCREQTCNALAIARTSSFYMGLTSAEGQKLECFKCTGNYIFLIAMKI